jgi:uncharacterized protein (DUF342 family)
METAEQAELETTITPDRMAVLLSKGTAQLALQQIPRLLEQIVRLGVKPPPTESELQAVLQQAVATPPTGELCLLRGITPSAPQDSTLNWASDFFTAGFCTNGQTQRIDYKRRAQRPEVQPGQLLATLTTPVDGTAGCDLQGHRQRAERAKRLRVRAGVGVREEEAPEGKLYFATVTGRVRFDSEVISVDEVLSISGDAGMETGHIHHNGAVLIAGDVKPGFRVEASGDITIHGTVEGAEIICGGNLIVDSGITGSMERGVIVKGTVKALYLSEVQLDAEGDVMVENEIIHSQINTTGALLMPHGHLIGGEICAAGGILVGETGCERCTPTHLIAGKDPHLVAALVELRTEVRQHEANLEKIKTTLESARVIQNRLSATQREALTELMYKASEIEQAIVAAHEKEEALRRAAAEHCKPFIRIEHLLHAETTLQLGETKRMFNDAYTGPIQALVQCSDLIVKAVEHPKSAA